MCLDGDWFLFILIWTFKNFFILIWGELAYIYFCFIDYAKAFDCGDHNKLGKFWKRWEYQTTWSASWEICMQVRKQQLELDMEQQTGSK